MDVIAPAWRYACLHLVCALLHSPQSTYLSTQSRCDVCRLLLCAIRGPARRVNHVNVVIGETPFLSRSASANEQHEAATTFTICTVAARRDELINRIEAWHKYVLYVFAQALGDAYVLCSLTHNCACRMGFGASSSKGVRWMERSQPHASPSLARSA